MAQKLLRRLEVDTCCPQIGSKRVAKAMPPDCLARDPGPRHCGSNDLFQQRIRRQWLFAFQPNGRKDEIILARTWRLFPPNLEAFHNRGMKRDWFPASFGFGVSEVIAHAGTVDVYLHEFKINVAPCQRD